MNFNKRVNGSWTDTPHYIHNTSTDTITTPADIYTNDTTATVGLKGQMEQSGTPTPANPIQPQECGDLETEGTKAGQYKIPISSADTTTPVYLGEVETTRKIKKCVFRGVLDNDGWYYNSSIGEYDTYRTDVTSDKLSNVNMLLCTHFPNYGSGERITAYEKSLYIYVKRSEIGSLTELIQFLQQQNSNGTPVTVWYVRKTPQTGIVNEPLRKIGDYADEVSGITIPTIAGANTISVDTTLPPSEVSVNYKGWHPVSAVHERENGQWD